MSNRFAATDVYALELLSLSDAERGWLGELQLKDV